MTNAVTAPSGPAIYVKLGGALLTAKDGREVPRMDVIRRLAGEVADGMRRAEAPVVLAHGSGSYAHVAVAESGFDAHPDDRLALARVAAAARRLDTLVMDALVDALVPAVAVPGSVLALCRDGKVLDVRGQIVRQLLDHGLVPVLYGDAAPDESKGGTVANTEALLLALADHVPVRRVLLATDVDGVFERDPHGGSGAPGPPVARLYPSDWPRLAHSLTGLGPGIVDVSGGMAGKVRAMFDLVTRHPSAEVRVLSGLRPGVLGAAMAGRPESGGTLITATP